MQHGDAPFTKAGTLATHYGGVAATKLLAVLIAVDRASTEQCAWNPELLAGRPAGALAGQFAAEPTIAYAEVLLPRTIRTWTAHIDIGLLTGVVPRVGYGFVCAATDADTHAKPASVEGWFPRAERVVFSVGTATGDNHVRGTRQTDRQISR
jgi:hypothetical protein